MVEVDPVKNIYAVVFHGDEGYLLIAIDFKEYDIKIKACCFKSQGISVQKIAVIDKHQMLVLAETYPNNEDNTKNESILIK